MSIRALPSTPFLFPFSVALSALPGPAPRAPHLAAWVGPGGWVCSPPLPPGPSVGVRCGPNPRKSVLAWTGVLFCVQRSVPPDGRARGGSSVAGAGAMSWDCGICLRWREPGVRRRGGLWGARGTECAVFVAVHKRQLHVTRNVCMQYVVKAGLKNNIYTAVSILLKFCK